MNYSARYTFDRSDYFLLQRALSLRSGWAGIKGLFFRAALAAFGIAIGYSTAAVMRMRLPVPRWTDALIVLVVVGVMYGCRWIAIHRAYPKFHGAGQTMSFEFTGSGIASELPGMKSQMEWRSIEGVMDIKDAMALFVSRQSAFLLPRRAFSSADDYSSVRKLAEENTKHLGSYR